MVKLYIKEHRFNLLSNTTQLKTIETIKWVNIAYFILGGKELT